MKRKLTQKLLIVASCLVLQFNLQAQNVFNNVTAGNLTSLLGNGMSTITDLTITGELNGDDFKTIRAMPLLTDLDIKGVRIVAGGGSYFEPGGSSYYTYTGKDTIGNEMFRGLTELTSIDLPDSLVSIKTSAFMYCSKLTDVIIPNNVTQIANEAFFHCTSITNVTLGSSVDSIEGAAFIGCSSLTEIESLNPVPPVIIGNAFSGVAENVTVYVPTGTKDEYEASEKWMEFKEIIERNFLSIDETDADGISIYGANGSIFIESEQSVLVWVYNISGQKVYESNIQGSVQINLNKGIYIVKTGDKTTKVVVD